MFLRASKYLKDTGGNVLKFTDYINEFDLKKINNQKFDNETLDNIKNYKLDGINIGEHANSGAIRYFSSSNFKNFKNNKQILTKYIKAGLITKKICENLFSKKNYDEVFLNHGIYVPQGVILDCAKKFNINTSCWCYAYSRNSVNITRNDTYHKALIHEEEHKWKNFEFDKDMEDEIDNFLKQRREGSEVLINDNWDISIKNQNLDVKKFFLKNKINLDKPLVGLATNSLWDAQIYYPNNLFKDILEWLFYTIDYFSKREDVQLIIRIHPAEVLSNAKSLERIEDVIRSKYKDLPKNIFIVKPDDKISTYSIFKSCNAVLVYASKIAMETMSMKIPTIVCGESFLKNKSISFDPISKDEYKSLLNQIPFKENYINAKRLNLAKKYAYHFFFRRTIKINSLYERKSKHPNVGIRGDIKEIFESKNDPGLKSIVDAVLNGDDFIFKYENQKKYETKFHDTTSRERL